MEAITDNEVAKVVREAAGYVASALIDLRLVRNELGSVQLHNAATDALYGLAEDAVVAVTTLKHALLAAELRADGWPSHEVPAGWEVSA